MSFALGNFIAATGKNGALIAQNNGSGGFTKYSTGVSVTLRAVGSNIIGNISSAKALIVGDTGTILLTGGGSGPGAAPVWTSITAQTSGTSQNLYGCAVSLNGNGNIAVGAGGTILHDTGAGTTWSAQTSGTVQDLNAACWDAANNKFVVVGNNGVILTSSNGTSWTAQTSGTSHNLLSALYISTFISGLTGSCMVVGAAGTRLITSNDTSWSTI